MLNCVVILKLMFDDRGKWKWKVSSCWELSPKRLAPSSQCSAISDSYPLSLSPHAILTVIFPAKARSLKCMRHFTARTTQNERLLTQWITGGLTECLGITVPEEKTTGTFFMAHHLILTTTWVDHELKDTIIYKDQEIRIAYMSYQLHMVDFVNTVNSCAYMRCPVHWAWQWVDGFA